jgi:competence protein ComEC
MVRMTIGAVLFTLPISVWLAGGISAISPAGNIVAGIPFGLFLIPSAVLMDWATLLSWFPLEPIIYIWLKVAGIVLGSMSYLADLPFSFQPLSPTGCLAATLATVIGILVWRWKRYRLRVGIAIFCFILAVSGSVQFISERICRDDLVISFPRVGQADAAIIRHNGRTVLVDCGPGGFPGLSSPVARTLQRLGVRNIDALFLSHHHPDHAGGLEDIIAMWPIEVLYLPDWCNRENGLENLEGAVRAGAKVRFLNYGDEVNIASLRFKVFGPEKVKKPLKDINRGSQQLLLEVGDFLALFTGDAGWDQVQRSLSRVNSLDLIKIPHHGSKKNFPPAGMDDSVTLIGRQGDVIAVCPSRPPGNRHLTAPEVVRWFEGRGVRFVYTGDNGVKIRYKKGVSSENGSTIVDNHDWF